MRLGAVFVALCMMIIAGSAGAIGYLYFDRSASEAAVLAIGTLAALALYNAVANRIGLRSMVGHQLADLSRGTGDLALQVAEMGRRLAAMETSVESAVDRTRAITDPLTVEVGELRTLVKQQAETVATHQTKLDALVHAAPASAPAAVSNGRPHAGRSPDETLRPAQSTGDDRAAASDSSGRVLQEPTLAMIRDATQANRIDLYLQPIVTLPHRKVRYYEAMSRLRNETGEVLQASYFISQAESGGLMPQIDNLLNRSGSTSLERDSAELSDLLGRFGIDLIADRIENESSVVDLLDQDVRYGQGFLFSPPRPVRPEALQALVERAHALAPEQSAAALPEERERTAGW
jgi:cyclic-di-GMP phosphodiesterase, flagellum assembly factor TipF